MLQLQLQRFFRQVELRFDIVAVFGSNVERIFVILTSRNKLNVFNFGDKQ